MNNQDYINEYVLILDNLFQDYKKKLDNQRVGVLVSGGIDSSIIAYYSEQCFPRPHFLTLQTNKGKDYPYVKLLGQFLKINPVIINIKKNQVKETVPRIIKILKDIDIQSNKMQVALGSVFYLACQEAKKLNINTLFTGQGPDVLLGGYSKYKRIGKNEKLKTLIKEDLSLLEIDKKRDQAMASEWGIQLINPYLEKDFVDFALSLSEDFLIYNEQEKYISRLLGKDLGLPDQIVWRPKKAMQYSTGIQRLIK